MQEIDMETLLQYEIVWGLSVWQLSLAGILIVLSIFCRGIVLALFRGVLGRRSLAQKVAWVSDVLELMPRPVGLIVRLLLWVAVARLLNLPQEPVNVHQIVLGGLWIAFSVAAVWTMFRLTDCASRWAERMSDRTSSKLDDQLVPLLTKVAKVAIFAVVGVMVIERLGFSVTGLVASLGLGGLALALAAKDTVSNVFGSLVVFADQPFQVDDWIEIDGVEGIVEEVGIRTTRVRQFDRSLATIPNSRLTGNTVVNYSKRTGRKIRICIGIEYAATADQLEKLVEDVRAMLQQMPDLDPAGMWAYVDSFNDSSIDLLAQGWTKTADFGDYMAAKERLLLGILRLVDQHGLEIAFPTRTVYLSGGTEKAASIHG